MIPKIINYCWFGRNPLPDYAKKYIATWRKYLPDYEIKEWNEDNFDVNIIPYTQEAYQAKKYAFVSDYARFWILYHYGGVYFDTDVEVIKNMDDIIARGPFMGIENVATPDRYETVGAGLGLGAEKGMPLYKQILDNYQKYHFRNTDGSLNLRTVVQYVTVELCRQGLKRSNELQLCAGTYIYPKEFFNPKGGDILKITENTRTIHQYSSTWVKGSKGIQDASSIRFKLNKKKADLKHWLKKYTIRHRNRVVITNNYLSDCYQSTYSLHCISPFGGSWISDEDFIHIDKMIEDLKNGRYSFIRMNDSKYKDQLFYDYPILRFEGCGAEAHYECRDSEDDVKVEIEQSLKLLASAEPYCFFVTDNSEEASKFQSSGHHHFVISSKIDTADIKVSALDITKALNSECKVVCGSMSKI